jgi:dihydroflavonol-4-reductase
MIRHIAITGATGHIGANMVRGLLARGFSVRALYRSARKRETLEGLGAELQQCDVLDPDSLHAAFAGMDAVIHLAALISIAGDPEGKVMQTNVEGTRHVVQACLACGVRRLIHFSSIHAFQYNESEAKVTEDNPPAGQSNFAYDQSKAASEAAALRGLEQGLEVLILNPTAVIGPYSHSGAYAGQMLLGMLENRFPALVQGGFDWVDARDLVEGTAAALEKGRSGERYILSGHWASIAQLAAICARFSGKRPPRLVLPLGLALLGLPFLQAYSRLAGSPPLYTYESLMTLKHSNRHCSHEKARRELGYHPRPLEETVRGVYEWYMAEQGDK